MKRLNIFLCIALIALFVLAGCGKKTANEPKDDPVISTKEDNEGGSIEHGEGYGFDQFELVIDFDEQDTIKIDYAVKKTTDAYFINTLENFDLEGPKAMDKINELFMYLFLSKDTPEKEARSKILSFFDLEDYTRFKLDVYFDEDTELHIDDTKES